MGDGWEGEMEFLLDRASGTLALCFLQDNTSLSDFCSSFLVMAAKDPCKKHACEIQKCLQANNYLESKCEAVFQEMRRCCAHYPKGVSLSCSGFKGERKESEKQVPDSNPPPTLKP
ncbi:cx9C motif-containing protein 4 isoform X1 [Pituophis catenifer annectens]|uniref:cx9C motif-containing protein 4 isoform X1 n=2 Tax=Pituophis catenifer annectens TaxID=94852 RepID=UPI0039968F52